MLYVCRAVRAFDDQDGVVVVPAAVAQEVYDIAHSREIIEGIIKEQVNIDIYIYTCLYMPAPYVLIHEYVHV